VAKSVAKVLDTR